MLEILSVNDMIRRLEFSGMSKEDIQKTLGIKRANLDKYISGKKEIPVVVKELLKALVEDTDITVTLYDSEELFFIQSIDGLTLNDFYDDEGNLKLDLVDIILQEIKDFGIRNVQISQRTGLKGYEVCRILSKEINLSPRTIKLLLNINKSPKEKTEV